MSQMSRFSLTPRVWTPTLKPLAGVLLALASAGAACSDNKGDASACDGGGGGGPVMSSAPDTHCKSDSGTDIVQSIGMCVAAADNGDAAANAEEFGVFYGREADDDDCKYHVSFTNTCIQQNQDVTFTVKLIRKSDGSAASGAQPANPEI